MFRVLYANKKRRSSPHGLAASSTRRLDEGPRAGYTRLLDMSRSGSMWCTGLLLGVVMLGPLMTANGVAQSESRGQAAPASPAGSSAAPGGAQADADSLQRKLEDIVTFGAIPRLETKSTVLLEREVNAYVHTYLREDLPAGVTEPRIEIVGDRVLRGSVVLDMDAYRASRPPSTGFDPFALLSGKLTARARGRLITADGEGRFELDEADLAGIPLPRFLVQQLLTFYSRTPDQPDGIRLDDPFYLPVSIREIRVLPGEALVIQ